MGIALLGGAAGALVMEFGALTAVTMVLLVTYPKPRSTSDMRNERCIFGACKPACS